MALNRRDALATLKTILEEITEIKTVVRSYGGRTRVAGGAGTLESFDITNYKIAELPLIEIQEPMEETEQQNVGMRAMMVLGCSLKIWFVSWHETPQTDYETLVKKVRDKIGANFNLIDGVTGKGTVTGIWVLNVSLISGELPVYNIEIELAMKYYLNQEDS